MPLPPKSYFHLSEIIQRWGASESDLGCYALDGLLQFSIMATGVRVETGTFEEDKGGLFRLSEGETILNGPQPVVSSDLWPVFRHGSARIARFKPRTAHGYVDLAEGHSPILVSKEDLLVTRTERDRFEAVHGLVDAILCLPGSAPAAITNTEAATPAFLHRNHYSEVVLAGEIFHLGPLQSSIVRQLHEACLAGQPWRHGKDLLAGANAQTLRMVDLFKGKQNWRTLIASDGRGHYRLNLPDRPAARPSHRAYRRFPTLFMRPLPPSSHSHPTLSHPDPTLIPPRSHPSSHSRPHAASHGQGGRDVLSSGSSTEMTRRDRCRSSSSIRSRWRAAGG